MIFRSSVFYLFNSVSAAPKYTDRVIAQSAQSIPAPQLIGTDSNYLGAGISGGLTNSNVAGEQSRSGGALSGRYSIPQSKLSARAGSRFKVVLVSVSNLN